MSPQVGNFVHDLVEMAKAQERMPILESELEHARRKIEELEKHNQHLESHIFDYKGTIERLTDEKRSLEVQRDDAEYRFLEVEEKSNKVLALLDLISSHASDARAVVEPPKPQPEPEPVQQTEQQPQGQGETTPTHTATPYTNDSTLSASNTATHTEDVPMQTEEPTRPSYPSEVGGGSMDTTSTSSSGQSDPHPTASATPTPEQPSVIALPHSGTATNSEPHKGEYYGKKYHDVPHYVSLHEWLDKGGTEIDYHWRPAAQRSVY